MHPMSFTHQQFLHFNSPQVAPPAPAPGLWGVSSRPWLSIRKREMECLTITVAAVGDLSADATSSSSAKGSGTTARGRRLLKVREEKRKREYERLHNYPAWAKVLEDACKHDTELRAVLGDSIGNPELMRKRVEERVRAKGQNFYKSKTGSVLAFKVSFRDWICAADLWFPSDRWNRISSSEKELIKGMLCKDPSQRLTTQHILDHAWVRDSSSHFNEPCLKVHADEGSYPSSLMARNPDISFGTGSGVLCDAQSPKFTCRPSFSTLLTEQSTTSYESAVFSFSSTGGSNGHEFATPVPTLPSFTFFGSSLVFDQGSYEVDLSVRASDVDLLHKDASVGTVFMLSDSPVEVVRERTVEVRKSGSNGSRTLGIQSRRNHTIGLGEFEQLDIMVTESVIRWTSCTCLPTATSLSFNPLDSYIWFELYGSPSERDVNLLGSVIQSWYVIGRLGAFNSSNLQLGGSSLEFDPLYDADKGSKVMPSSFHDISNVEFQDNWGRVWVDLGTADFFSIDVLLNCLTVLSSEYLGIQQVVFGGRRMGDWEEGMTNSGDGYKYFEI